MTKPDHPALFPPGGHPVSVAQLMALAISPHPTPRRLHLWQSLCAFIIHLQRMDLAGMDLWVDGSFITSKAQPSDIDAVLWVTQDHVRQCTDAQYSALLTLQNRPAVKLRYGIDLYLGQAANPIEEARWRAKFGTCHDDITPKGYAILTL